jgi:hypothetical protein
LRGCFLLAVPCLFLLALGALVALGFLSGLAAYAPYGLLLVWFGIMALEAGLSMRTVILTLFLFFGAVVALSLLFLI